jgi:hypothetical protein
MATREVITDTAPPDEPPPLSTSTPTRSSSSPPSGGAQTTSRPSTSSPSNNCGRTELFECASSLGGGCCSVGHTCGLLRGVGAYISPTPTNPLGDVFNPVSTQTIDPLGTAATTCPGYDGYLACPSSIGCESLSFTVAIRLLADRATSRQAGVASGATCATPPCQRGVV